MILDYIRGFVAFVRSPDWRDPEEFPGYLLEAQARPGWWGRTPDCGPQFERYYSLPFNQLELHQSILSGNIIITGGNSCGKRMTALHVIKKLEEEASPEDAARWAAQRRAAENGGCL